jgi:type IV pilus assembly protein PilW
MSGAAPECPLARRPQGFGLVELLVALAIAALVIAGTLSACVKAREVQAALDSHARLQETARYALAIVEADLRMAGFWGLVGSPASIAANPASSFPTKCGGAAWITATERYVDGSNNGYLSAPNCAASSGGARAGADVLVIRRASVQRTTPQRPVVAAADRDRLMIVSHHGGGEIFVPRDLGGAIPTGFATADLTGEPPLADTREYLVNAYYVSADSSVARGYPALRRKLLTTGPEVTDEEVVAGVEDLQFELGVDVDGDAQLDAFLNPGAMPMGAVPLSVRLWMRVRALERDPAYRDTRTVSYADRTAAATGDRFRRLLVARTVSLRNARP